jgi:hypothetical protein
VHRRGAALNVDVGKNSSCPSTVTPCETPTTPTPPPGRTERSLAHRL